jgi:Zn-dependent peptidase ImmA (M78 family)
LSLKTDAYYKTIADAALRQTGITEPPVTVEAVAGRMGIPVRLVQMPAFFSGATINEDGMPVLVLNAALEETGSRRCLAHLLAHVLIVLDSPEAGYPRNTTLSHREADVVADELILPSWMVVEQATKWFNDHRYLARLFGVTENDMTAKMRELGLMRARSIAWDY